MSRVRTLRSRLRPAPERRWSVRARATAAGATQPLVALAVNSSTSLVAGALLGSITHTFERLPGLLILVPAAIGLRGNVFAALGNRLSTAIHTGTFTFSFRADTVLGQNVRASLYLTGGLSLTLAAVAKVVAIAFGVQHTIPLLDMAAVSVVGGLLASAAVLAATVALTLGSVRYDWDLDNLVAPVVSTLGDVLTLPALWLAAHLIGGGRPSQAIGGVLAALAMAGTVAGFRAGHPRLRSVMRESWPVLLAAVVLSTLAGVVIEKRLATFATYPALLVLVPAFVSSAGALGGVLSSRLATKLHLGTLAPALVPDRGARADGLALLGLGLPIYVLNGAGAHVVGRLTGAASPGLVSMLAASLAGGAAVVMFVIGVAYYGSIAAARLGVDPDTYGVPIVTSSVDFAGAIALIVAIVALGIS